MRQRPIAAAVTVAAILLLGLVAGSRLRLEYRPALTFPGVWVVLDLPDRQDTGSVARDWFVPVEAAIRSVGSVDGIAGRIGPRGGWLEVRFLAGTDPETRAARLQSALMPLRRRLPPRARLDLYPMAVSAGERSMVIDLAGPGAETEVDRVAERLRRIPGVRDIDALVPPEPVLRFRPD